MNVKIKRLSPDAVVPRYACVGDSGFDLVSTTDVIVEPGATVLVPTGLSVELPPGYEMQIRPRSGVSLRTKLRVANAPGTVDSGYRAEVGVIIDNLAEKDVVIARNERGWAELVPQNGVVFRINGGVDVEMSDTLFANSYIIRKGDRIAQGVIQRVETVTLVEVAELSETERGAGAFGHSGVRAE